MKKRTEKEVRAEQLEDLHKLMSADWGRRIMYRLTEDICGLSKSVLRGQSAVASDERLVYNAAKQDIGHFLRDEVEIAHPVALELMRNEKRMRDALENEQDKKSEDEDNG